MADNLVSIERSGPVAVVRFDRNEKLNAMNYELVKALTEAAYALRDDIDVHAIVVTGGEKYFSSGADLSDKRVSGSDLSVLEKRRIVHAGGELCRAWEDLPQVTIAAINGLAVGAGFALALACDLRVMEEDAYVIVPEIKRGMNLQWNTVPRLVSLAGPAVARRITFFGEKILAPSVFEAGLVDKLSENGKAFSDAMEWALQVAEGDPLSTRMVKKAINAAANVAANSVSFADADQSLLCSLLNKDLRKIR